MLINQELSASIYIKIHTFYTYETIATRSKHCEHIKTEEEN